MMKKELYLLKKEEKRIIKLQKEEYLKNLKENKKEYKSKIKLEKQTAKALLSATKMKKISDSLERKAKGKLSKLDTETQKRIKEESKLSPDNNELKLIQVKPFTVSNHDSQLMCIPQKKFRLSSKKLYMTYSRCSLTPTEVLDQLKIRLWNYIIDTYLIVQENHQLTISNKIETHIHVFLKLKKKCNIKDSNFLDLVGEDRTNFHGKYESCKSEQNIIEYLCKDIKPGSVYVASEYLSEIIGEFGNLKNVSATMIELARKGQISRAMDLLELSDPKSFARSHDIYRKSFEELYNETFKVKPKFNLDDFNENLDLIETISNALAERLTTIIFGESGIGKSHYIRALLIEKFKLYPLIISNFDSLREYSQDKHGVIVFDDVDITGRNRSELLALFNFELGGTLHCRYKNVRINPEVPRFFIQNMSMLSVLKSINREEDTALTRRIVDIPVMNLFYSKEKDLTLPLVIYVPILPQLPDVEYLF